MEKEANSGRKLLLGARRRKGVRTRSMGWAPSLRCGLRRLTAADFRDFDLVLVMDGANEDAARAICPPAHRHKLMRLTDFCTRHAANEVPDPYYGGDTGFEQVLDLVEDACDGLMAQLRALRPGAAG